jgi:ABC-type transport system substrate-binding protein
MWIKRLLVVVPVLLLLFLFQSVFWVPGTQQAADNLGRLNRIILYQGGDPSDMNPWSSTTTTDSTIFQYLYEGMLRYDRDYIIEPWLSEYAAIHHELVAPVPPGMDLDQFREHLQNTYGGKFTGLEPAQSPVSRATEESHLFDLTTGRRVESVDAAAKVVAYRRPAMARITLAAPRREGEIASVVDPDFGKDLYGAHMEHFLEPQGQLSREDITAEAVAGIAATLGLPSVTHNPVVEMRVRPGIYWTDGPFFTPPERTWEVTIDGDVAGTFVADSAQEAENNVRARHHLAPNVKISVRGYEQRFGDEEKGPWWGRGPEFTARDPKVTYDLIRDPDFGSPRRSSWLEIKEVRLDPDDAYRLEVVYGRLYSPAISNLTGAVIPYHVWNTRAWTEEAIRKGRGPEQMGFEPGVLEGYNVKRALPMQERDFRHKPSSLGPFVLEPLTGDARPLWRSAEIVTLRRNEFHWERKPEYEFLDYLLFDPALGRETSEIAFLSGSMDVYTARDFQVERYRSMGKDYYVLERETTQYEYIGFNCSRGPLQSAKVRLALSMAVDGEEILKYVVYSQGKRISGPAYPVLPWYNHEYRREHTWRTGPNKGQTEHLKFLPFNLEEARALLAEEGFTLDPSGTLVKDGLPFRIRMVNGAGGSGTRQDIAMLARENWHKLGLRVDYEEYEWNVFINQYVESSNFDVVILGWFGGLDFDKRQLFHTKYPRPQGLNAGRFSSEKADALMERILEVYDPEEQVRLSHEIFAAIADECPYIFLFSPYNTAVMDRRIVWRKEVGRASDGIRILEDRPVNHEHIVEGKQVLSFYVHELRRVEAAPAFTEEDRTR